MKSFLTNVLKAIKNNYGLIFIFLLYLACIIKQVYYVGMADSQYHFGYHFIFGLSRMKGRILILMFTYGFLFSFAFLFKNWMRYIYCVVIYALTLGFIIGDLAYTRFFQGPSSIFWKIMPHNSNNDVVMSIWVHYSPLDALFFIDALIFIAMLVFGFVKKWFKPTPLNLRFKLTSILTAFFLVVFSTCCNTSQTILSENSTDLVSSYGNFIYHLEDIAMISNYNNTKKMSSKDKKNYVKYDAALKRDASTAIDSLSYDSILADTNLFVFQMEAIESFVIGNSINGQEITPNINKLLSHSLQLNVYEQVRTGNSSDCDLMFMTGQYPVSKVITFNQFPQSDLISLADAFNTLGYETRYLNGAYGSTWNYTGVMDKSLGFKEAHYGDEIFEKDYYKNADHKKVCGYISDSLLLKYENELLSSIPSTSKFYSHAVLCSSHIPWEMQSWIDEAFLNDKKLKSKISSYMYNYITLAHYVDACIGEMLDNLDLDNTTIVIMGDHGGIHKYMSNRTKKYTENKKYKWMTSAASYTVPCIIYNKNLTGHTVIGTNGNDYNFNNDAYKPTTYIEKKCGQVDILPTLSYMYGITNKFDYTKNGVTASSLMGRNMLKTDLSYAILANGIVKGKIPNDYKELEKAQHLSNVLIKSLYYGKC